MEELFQHLRGHFNKVTFGGDAAYARPGLPATEDGMHQVPKLVEEGDHIAVLHQARIIGFAAGEVADQRCLGKLTALDSRDQRRRAEPLVFAFAGMHVQVETATELSAVVDIPGAYLGMPDAGLVVALEADVEEPGRGIEYAFLHGFDKESRGGRIASRNRRLRGGTAHTNSRGRCS